MGHVTLTKRPQERAKLPFEWVNLWVMEATLSWYDEDKPGLIGILVLPRLTWEGQEDTADCLKKTKPNTLRDTQAQ